MPEETRCMGCGRVLGALERRMAYRQGGACVCPACYTRICGEAGLPERFKAPSAGGTAAKLIIGFLFVASMPVQNGAGAALVALVLGLALIAWGVGPIWWLRKSCDAAVARALAEKERAADETRRCPACGGVSAGPTCEYCGSPLPDSSIK